MVDVVSGLYVGQRRQTEPPRRAYHHSMPRLIRHPYALGGRLHSANGTSFELLRVSIDTEFGMSTTMSNFLKDRAWCVHCNERARDFEEHMACGNTTVRGKRKDQPARLFVKPEHSDALMEIDFKERTQRWSFQRKLRVRSALGSHTREEIMVLRQLQEDRCFYCFASLLGPGGGMNGPAEPVTCHKDHFSPLRREGTNFINNIVLACPSCNSSKGEQDGMPFLLEHMRKASQQDRMGLKRIHAARKKHRYHLEPTEEYLAAGLNFNRM